MRDEPFFGVDLSGLKANWLQSHVDRVGPACLCPRTWRADSHIMRCMGLKEEWSGCKGRERPCMSVVSCVVFLCCIRGSAWRRGMPTRVSSKAGGEVEKSPVAVLLHTLGHPELRWLALFLPALVGYLYLLEVRLSNRKTIGSIEIASPVLYELLPNSSTLEVVAEGFLWTEGPLWVDDAERGNGYLLFSDTKRNKIFKWEEGAGAFTVGTGLYLNNSGCRYDQEACASLTEPGSNGLTLEPESGLLVMCQHGERRVARLEANGSFTPLATHYQGRRLNSPNDLVFSRHGDLFFTDPPYGLNGKEDDPQRELTVSGVYRVPVEALRGQTTLSTSGPSEIQLLHGGLKRPNGLAFSPDYRRLYVSNSDADDPKWIAIEFDEDGLPTQNVSTWMEAKPFQHGGERTGNPDGFKVDEKGNLFASGPGGVLIFSPAGDHLGTILTGKKTANVAFGRDGYLYVCASDVVARIKVKTKGNAIPR